MPQVLATALLRHCSTQSGRLRQRNAGTLDSEVAVCAQHDNGQLETLNLPHDAGHLGL
jgi:hypothetical protein